MQIDWFTLIAQIVNFLILVFLLRYFLYDRITHAMDRREENIASRLNEAEARKREAEGEVRSYKNKQEELEEKRSRLISEAHQEAEEQKKKLLQKAKEEVDQSREKWYRAIEQQKEAFLAELKKRAGESVHQIARRFLRELADTNLQSKMIDTFMKKIRQVEAGESSLVRLTKEQGLGEVSSGEGEGEILLISSFDIEPELRQKLSEALEGEKKEEKVRFQVSRSLICGLELHLKGKKIAWSLDSYLDGLEERVGEALKRNPLA